MEYLSIKQIAEKWEISVRRIQTQCSNGSILGAQKVGYSWIIPASEEKPKDERIKTDNYIYAQTSRNLS